MLSGRPRPVALEMPMDVMAREGWIAGEPTGGRDRWSTPSPIPTRSSARPIY